MYKRSLSQAILIIIIVAILAGCGVYFYKQHQSASIKQPHSLGISVEVERVRIGSLSRNVQVVGILEANNTVTLKAQVRGLVSQVFFKGGEEVKAGDKIFALDNRAFKAVYKEAEASQVMAKFEYKRAVQLHNKKFSSQKNLDKAKSDFLRAEAGFEKAQKELEDTLIVAPYEGVISLHKISIGTSVSPEMELLKITDIDPMKVDFKVPAKFYAYLNIGQSVEIFVDSVPDQIFVGEIEAIDSQVDPNAQQIAVRATVNNENRILKPGLLARVKIIVGSKDDSLIVPAEAVESNGDQSYVYKVIEHPEQPGVYVVFKVPITIGIQEEERVEITRGIYNNDIIVVVGQQKLKDGYPVKFDLTTINTTSAQETDTIPESAAPQITTDKQPALSWWQKAMTKMRHLFTSKNSHVQPVIVKQDKPQEVTQNDDRTKKMDEDKTASEPTGIDRFVNQLTRPKKVKSFTTETSQLNTDDSSESDKAKSPSNDPQTN